MAAWSGVGDYAITEIGPVCCIHVVVFPYSCWDCGQTGDFTDVKMTLGMKLSVCLSSKAIYFCDQVERMVMHIVMYPC